MTVSVHTHAPLVLCICGSLCLQIQPNADRKHLGIPQTQAQVLVLPLFPKQHIVTTLCIYIAFGINNNRQNKTHGEIKYKLYIIFFHFIRVLNIYRVQSLVFLGP